MISNICVSCIDKQYLSINFGAKFKFAFKQWEKDAIIVYFYWNLQKIESFRDSSALIELKANHFEIDQDWSNF